MTNPMTDKLDLALKQISDDFGKVLTNGTSLTVEVRTRHLKALLDELRRLQGIDAEVKKLRGGNDEVQAKFYWRYVGGDCPEAEALPRELIGGIPGPVDRQRAEHYGAQCEVLRAIKWTTKSNPLMPDPAALGRWLYIRHRGDYPNMINTIPEYPKIAELLMGYSSLPQPPEQNGKTQGESDGQD